MCRIRVVREVGISLRIGIANALDIRRSKAKRLATDGRCVGERDSVLPKTGVTGTNVQLFAHYNERKKDSAEMVRRWGSNHLGKFEQFLRGMEGVWRRRVCHEAEGLLEKSGGCRRESRLTE